MKKIFILLLFISLFSVWPFFKKGFFQSHDGEWMIIRFTAFHQTLAAGQFPVRFVDRLNGNFGYPVLNFLYPLPFYLSEIPKILGFGFVDSVKITFIFSTVLSALFMFWALMQIFSKEASFAGAIVYLFIPYRFVDLYVRGSLGESVAFAVAPLVLGSIFKIVKGNKIYLPILSITIALLILSHNVIAILFIPLMILLSFILITKDKLFLVISFITGFLIASFYWLPAIYNLQFVKLSQVKISNISDHLVSFSNLIVPQWGYGPTPNSPDGLSAQIGIVSIAIFISAIYLRLRLKNKDMITALLILIFVLCILMMTTISLPIWQLVPYLDIIQFPWRLLSIIVLISALLTAFVVDTNKKRRIVASLIVIASIISTFLYIKPQTIINKNDSYYSTNEDTTTVRDEYLPLWVQEKPTTRANQKIDSRDQLNISNLRIKPTNYSALINSKIDTNITVNSIYFPGWQVKVDGKRQDINYQNKYGLINFKLPKGSHQVIINYGKSPLHLISELISVISLIGVSVYLIILWRKQNSW